MTDMLVIIAIGTIIAGSLILAGLALWLAADRRRYSQSASRRPTSQQSGNTPAKAAQPSRSAPAVPAEPKAPAQPRGAAGPAGANPAKDAVSSGEYPAAALYDQTILPPPPKRRTRSQT